MSSVFQDAVYEMKNLVKSNLPMPSVHFGTITSTRGVKLDQNKHEIHDPYYAANLKTTITFEQPNEYMPSKAEAEIDIKSQFEKGDRVLCCIVDGKQVVILSKVVK
ncbi:hypothetical protein VQL36_11485 [Chengkuizengella sp. SCS-71B]|uniref:hypothetical protein n=1 Tax=Chengkuizengella sp. SCS-71B TaxID=3115290 RepID=UPI0032C219A1